MVVGIINREVAEYTSRPEVVKKRIEQNKARRLMEKKGLVKKGDGKDVDHIKPLSKGGKTIPSNLRVVSASQNRSFERGSLGELISNMTRKKK